MANPALFIRVAATISELRANLAEGKSQIETTTAAMQKLAASFSGDKLIQAAHNVTAAVNQIGGAAKLTEAEQARVNATLEKALEKYRVLGREAPIGMQQLADATKGAREQGESWSTTLGKASGLLSALGVSLSIAGIVSFGRSLLATADELTKLHDKTGISIVGLQRFQIVGDDASNTIDEISSAIVKMADNLAGRSNSVVQALEFLGLRLSDLKRLSPEAQFIAISDAIRQIEDPAQRIALAIDLFGRQGASILPTLVAGFDDVKGAAVGMSEETVRILNTIGDALGKFARDFTGAAGEALANSVLIFTDPLGFAQGKRVLDDITVAAEKAAPAVAGIGAPPIPENLRELEDALTKDAEAAIKLNTEAEKAAEALGKLQETHERLISSIADKLFGGDDIKRATDYAAAIGAVENVSNMNITAQQEVEKVMRAGVEAMVAAGLGTDQLTSTFEAMRLQAGKTARDAAASFQQITDSARTAAGEMAGLTIIGQTPPKPSGNVLFGNRPTSAGYQLPQFQMPQFGTPAPPSSLAQTGVVVFDGRASGGPVSAGQPYTVGERGPELFIPDSAGRIVPNGGGGSNITIAAGAVQINYPLMNDPRARMEIAAMVGDAIMARLRGQGLRVPSGA